MTITIHTRRRVYDAIPPEGAPLRVLAERSKVHLSNVRMVIGLMDEERKVFTARFGTGKGCKHERWVFPTMESLEAFSDKWEDLKAQKIKARQDARIAARKAERATEEHRSLVAIAAERREEKRRAAKAMEEKAKADAKVKLTAKQAKLRKETAAVSKKEFKGGTLSPKPKKSAWTDLPAHIPDDVEAVELPNSLRGRFEVEEAPPLFSSLRPGQYIAPAPAWLQGVAA